MIPRNIYQLQFQSENDQGLKLARAVLLNLGYEEKDLASYELKGKGGFELFGEDRVKIQRVQRLFERLNLAGIKIRLRHLAPEDWLTRWKAHWKPAPLTGKIDVVPVWCRNKYRPRRGRDYILMDTLLSFGTGLHETTRFMARFIEANQGKFKSFLDIGTGTGILAIVALKYGARDVSGIDIEALSVQAAKDNMKANQLYFFVEQTDIKKYRSKKRFDFVAANLITEDLIEHGRKIISFVKEGGLLAVSGISLENLNRFRKMYSSLPLEIIKVSKGKKWSGLLFQKRK